MKKFQHIGTIELVSLPGEQIENVPAKIDTGADGSAIWASQIIEQSGKLMFVLFDKTSPFYTGKVLTLTDYKVISVKNSFGQTEHRYKVTLKLALVGRTIQAMVTLADRGHSRYPILIGRRTLQGKFVVDVARKPAKDEARVLMLSTKRGVSTGRFAKELERYGRRLHVTYAIYDDLRYALGGSSNRITLADDGQDIAGFDLVYFKTYARNRDLAGAAARYLQKRSVPFIDRVVADFSGGSKLYQYAVLPDHNIAVPRSIFMAPDRLKQSFNALEQELGLPFILKDIEGNKGEHNYLVKDKAAFAKACRAAAKDEVRCVAQTFVSNDEDYRVLVFGTKIELVIKRARTNAKTHLNNTSQGAKATLVPANELPTPVRADSLAAAKLLNRQVAGVDFVQDKFSGVWYCLEVNDGPQLATGSFTAEKHAAFAAYLERRVSK